MIPQKTSSGLIKAKVIKKNSTHKKSNTDVKKWVHNNHIQIITHFAQYTFKIPIYNRINDGNT